MKYSFDFALTTYCQAKCRSCARTDQLTGEKKSWVPLKHMDLEVFKQTLDSSDFKHKLRYIQFCGEYGDPCMHPQIQDFIEVASEYADRVHINTNGGLRQPAWYAKMAKEYPTQIQIKWGVDGADHDTNWLYREGVDWNRAMDNMRAWFFNGGIGKWHFLVFEWNWHQIPEAWEMAQEIGCEIEFKINNRTYGQISEKNKKQAVELIKQYEM